MLGISSTDLTKVSFFLFHQVIAFPHMTSLQSKLPYHHYVNMLWPCIISSAIFAWEFVVLQVLKGTGSLSALDFNSTGNSQPWKKACCGIMTQVHPHLPGPTLNQYTIWLAAQKARTLSWGNHRGVERYTVWRMANAYLLHTARYSTGERHRYCIRSLSILLSDIGFLPLTVITLLLVCRLSLHLCVKIVLQV